MKGTYMNNTHILLFIIHLVFYFLFFSLFFFILFFSIFAFFLPFSIINTHTHTHTMTGILWACCGVFYRLFSLFATLPVFFFSIFSPSFLSPIFFNKHTHTHTYKYAHTYTRIFIHTQNIGSPPQLLYLFRFNF